MLERINEFAARDRRTVAGALRFLIELGLDADQRARARGEISRATLDTKRARGERVSRYPPYGFAFDGGKLVRNEAEQETTRVARLLRSEGMNLDGIIVALERMGHKNRAGKRFSLSTIHAITKPR